MPGGSPNFQRHARAVRSRVEISEATAIRLAAVHQDIQPCIDACLFTGVAIGDRETEMEDALPAFLQESALGSVSGWRLAQLNLDVVQDCEAVLQLEKRLRVGHFQVVTKGLERGERLPRTDTEAFVIRLGLFQIAHHDADMVQIPEVAHGCGSMRQDLPKEILGPRLPVFRVAEELVLGTVFQDLTANVHEQHPISDLAGKAHFVGHHHHGHALLG